MEKKELIGLLETFARKLGTTGDNLWNVLIAQAKVVIWQNICFIIVTIISIFLLIKYIKWFKKDEEQDMEIENPHSWALVFSVICCVSFIFGSLVNFSEILTCIFNPKYYALEELFEALKQGSYK